MSDSLSFEALFEESYSDDNFKVGAVVSAEVTEIGSDYVVVSSGFKSDSRIPKEEFKDVSGKVEIEVGDSCEVYIVMLDDGWGLTRLSREKAKCEEQWRYLDTVQESGKVIPGLIAERVKGGFMVELGAVRAFLPGSLVDSRPVKDQDALVNQTLDFKVIKMDRKRNNIVVSRRAVLEESMGTDRQVILDSLTEGQEMKGVVKNITDYGAFVDLGGVDGLLHITDMAWKRVKHPRDLFNVGDEIDVKVLKIDDEKKRVSLGIKQLGNDPWSDLVAKFPIHSKIKGKVTNLTDYGCFVEIDEGVEGLVHMSEMDWSNKSVHPGKIVQLGDEVDVMVLEVDVERRRISLGIKQCKPNPWEEFANGHLVGDKVKGTIRSITDFGIFVGLTESIDGLIHASDISWDKSGEEAIRDFTRGEEVEAVILVIDTERERISLGLKQLEGDPIADYLKEHPKGTMVTGKVKDAGPKEAIIDLGDKVEGILRINELSHELINDVRDHVNMGDEITARVLGEDRRSKSVALTLKESHADAKGSAKATSEEPVSNSTLGDLLKDKMDSNDDNK